MRFSPALLVFAALLASPAHAADSPVPAPEQKAPKKVKEPRESKDGGLGGGLIDEISWPKDIQQAEEKAHKLVMDLIAKDPVKAGAIWSDFLDHVDQSAAEAGKPVGENTGERHLALMTSLADTKVGFPALMGFLSKFDRSPAAGSLGTWEGALGDSFTQRYAGFPQVTPEVDEQYLFQTDHLRYIVRFFQATAKDTPAGQRPQLAAFAVFEFFGSYRYQQYWNERDGALKWAESTLKPLHPLLWDAMTMAILTSDHSRLNAAQRELLFQRTLHFAGSPDLNPIEKISALAQMLEPSTMPIFDRPELVKVLAADAIAFMTPEQYLGDEKTIRLLTQISDYQSLTKEDAGKLTTRLAASGLLSQQNARMEEPLRERLSQLRLNLALRSEDQAQIAAANSALSSLHGRLDISLKLWQAGQAQSALLMLAPPDKYTVDVSNYINQAVSPLFHAPAFTKEMEDKLPEWLKSIQDPGQRFRYECLISCLQDAKGSDAPAQDRDTRLAALIERFPAEGPTAKASRVETLAALSLATGVAGKVRYQMEEMVSGTDMGELMTKRYSRAVGKDEAEAQEVLIRRSMRYRIEVDGDASGLLKQVKAITAVGGRQMTGWNMRQDLLPIFTFNAALVCRKIVESPPEMQTALLDNVRQICECFLDADERYPQQFAPGFAIMAYAAAGRGSDMDKWYGGLSTHQKEAYDYTRGRFGLPTNLRINQGYPLLDPAKTPQRRQLLKNFLCDQATTTREFRTPSEVSYMLDFQLFSKEDYFAVLEELPKDLPLRVKFFTEKAGMLGNRLGTEAEAMAAFDVAEKLAKEKGDPKDIAYVQAIKAKYYGFDLHRPEPAIALAKTIDLTALDEREKSWITEYLEEQEKKK